MTRYTLADVFANKPYPDEPLFLDLWIFDIPDTMRAAIRNAPANTRAISFNAHEMPASHRHVVEQECAARGIDVVWRSLG